MQFIKIPKTVQFIQLNKTKNSPYILFKIYAWTRINDSQIKVIIYLNANLQLCYISLFLRRNWNTITKENTSSQIKTKRFKKKSIEIDELKEKINEIWTKLDQEEMVWLCYICEIELTNYEQLMKEEYLMPMQWRRWWKWEKLKMASSCSWNVFFPQTESLTEVFLSHWIWMPLNNMESGFNRVGFRPVRFRQESLAIIVFPF
jgi:hypothetical protein